MRLFERFCKGAPAVDFRRDDLGRKKLSRWRACWTRAVLLTVEEKGGVLQPPARLRHRAPQDRFAGISNHGWTDFEVASAAGRARLYQVCQHLVAAGMTRLPPALQQIQVYGGRWT